VGKWSALSVFQIGRAYGQKKLSRGLGAVKTGRGACWLAEISAEGTVIVYWNLSELGRGLFADYVSEVLINFRGGLFAARRSPWCGRRRR